MQDAEIEGHGRRTPQGVRGLKLQIRILAGRPPGSHSARSAWIETEDKTLEDKYNERRTPQGVRGLKREILAELGIDAGRTPQGVRGLKLDDEQPFYRFVRVALRKECVD